MSRTRPLLGLALSGCIAFLLLLGGCDEGAIPERREIVEIDVPRVREVVREDVERGVVGVRRAAQKMARGFLVDDPARRATEMRGVLRRLREPTRGIDELMISPITFVAAVGMDGHVICRDIEPDPMAGFDAGAAFPHVREALEQGHESYRLVEFPSTLETDPPSITVLYVAPSFVDGRVVGAIMAGTPLWRTAQRLSRQLQAERAQEVANGLITWVYLYRGDGIHHHGTPSDLDTIVPDAAARAAGYAASPGGFTGQIAQFGRWYAYGVAPLPRIGDDVGVIVFRSDPE